jgi:hypothetical protein
MTQLLTVHHPCRLDLECPAGVPAPGPASDDLLKYLFSVRGKSVLDLGCGCGLSRSPPPSSAPATSGPSTLTAPPSTARAGTPRRNGVDVTAKVGDLFEPVDGGPST